MSHFEATLDMPTVRGVPNRLFSEQYTLAQVRAATEVVNVSSVMTWIGVTLVALLLFGVGFKRGIGLLTRLSLIYLLLIATSTVAIETRKPINSGIDTELFGLAAVAMATVIAIVPFPRFGHFQNTSAANPDHSHVLDWFLAVIGACIFGLALATLGFHVLQTWHLNLLLWLAWAVAVLALLGSIGIQIPSSMGGLRFALGQRSTRLWVWGIGGAILASFTFTVAWLTGENGALPSVTTFEGSTISSVMLDFAVPLICGALIIASTSLEANQVKWLCTTVDRFIIGLAFAIVIGTSSSSFLGTTLPVGLLVAAFCIWLAISHGSEPADPEGAALDNADAKLFATNPDETVRSANARIVLSCGPSRWWVNNGLHAVKCGAVIAIVPVTYFVVAAISHSSGFFANDAVAAVLGGATGQATLYLVIAWTFGALYRVLPFSIGPYKALLLAFIWWISIGAVEIVNTVAGFEVPRVWVFPGIEITIYVLLLSVVYDAATIKQVGGHDWKTLSQAYGWSKFQHGGFVPVASSVTLAVIAVSQQLLSGSASQFVTAVLSGFSGH